MMFAQSDPQITQIYTDFFAAICVHLRNLRIREFP